MTENEVLSLIIGQLVAYGYSAVAQSVANATGASSDLMPSSKLSELLQLAKEKMEEEESDGEFSNKSMDHDSAAADETGTSTNYLSGFDAESMQNAQPKAAPEFVQNYFTQHKGSCRIASFSYDGRFAATGSNDASLKLLDVSKMQNRTGDSGDKPVVRTLYDHADAVNDLSFHPNGIVLASCSNDQSIKLFDLSKSGVKRAFRYLQDASPVNSISFHPSGDFLLAGTKDSAVRVYDVRTLQCYTNSSAANVHQGSISQIRYSKTGKIFATSSLDGSVRIWDSVSSQCIKAFENAHSGAAVSSVRISKNEKYVLTAGLDSTMRLWEISSGNVIMEYKGHENRAHILQPTFSYNEGFVFIGDEASTSVFCWDTQTGALVKKITGHNDLVRCVAASPNDNGIITCSEDYRARYYGAY
ncbi:hypothetical protein G6F57_009320 [Rhizopus arrhizus]|uniref:Cleavage stimulation factor 50 kDa subunit n=1 Tax=Rhizopus oryzae TaxID=64495 RepID=A0A9P6X3L2_RHIOR|nr:hypothetical protein G6F23_007413 [Rhizopus arrhizus]KAG1416176.1 hypothetical protein G6F58_006102 [Rhizopus delemar]KAG0759407.1 hypothetical protein G6F24_009091 [Rhizopus arrhizus]KAG0785535.1 hypothetical protein G6F21_009194 [Rhizopus arrhizus]KAG0792999.1 hypothetical protein G6F22_005717 [Rhizopus arrhizus]